MYCFIIQKVSDYDQYMSQSLTVHQPMAPKHLQTVVYKLFNYYYPGAMFLLT